MVASACSSTPTAPDTSPSWLTALIARLESEPVANPPATIGRYDYKGQVVFFLPQRCCDQMSVLYGLDGSVICHPDGGITGKGDGRCSDFFAQRRDERLVWRDSRK